MNACGRRIEICGTVQGVGFRPWVYRLAHEAGVRGRVRNDAAGLTIEAFGSTRAVEAFCRRLCAAPPPAAAVHAIRSQVIPVEAAEDFVIVPSRRDAECRISIPADLTICEQCQHEIRDPANRRHRHPFTNCTDCGPRFTIAESVPYDRPGTTMAAFTMCPECRREYEDPADRRFHAQPNACPACGPRLEILDDAGRKLVAPDPLVAAACALRAGRIVAVKGLGGFHLACDATSSEAVARLRSRKRREAKPFAVMVRDLATARAIARLDAAEERLLTAVERPIVLVARRVPSAAPALCPEVAPRNALVGLMLSYTPLHHLLLAETERPLVMTSGNLADEPIAIRNQEALARLRGVADRFLVHDREIASRCDDSVARVIGGAPVVFRRSRGYVPRSVPVRRPFRRPVLACGAQLNNTFCLGVGDAAFLGPHVGDLESLASYEAFAEAVDRMERFVGVAPEVIAHDLHPEYLSTRYARERTGVRKIGVQHHHAHVASALAEAALAGPALGLVWDGAGYGCDGASWGGELLLADTRGFERLATFRPIPLAGGDCAIAEVWRIALALLEDAFDGDPPLDAIPLFAALPASKLATVRRMLAKGVNAPPAHGVGRYFDALGALVLGRAVSRFQGEIALEWNQVADVRESGAYPFDVQHDEGAPSRVDLRPLVRAVVGDLARTTPPATISARFHNALAAAAERLVRHAMRRVGLRPVVLTGGCFQNALLSERIGSRLAPSFRVVVHRDVPPGDGGLALGQAVVANAALDGAGGCSRCA